MLSPPCAELINDLPVAVACIPCRRWIHDNPSFPVSLELDVGVRRAKLLELLVGQRWREIDAIDLVEVPDSCACPCAAAHMLYTGFFAELSPKGVYAA
jgi:hypothetical protein